MRAAVIDTTGEASSLHEATVPVPAPYNSEFIVQVVAAGINPIDAKTRAGRGVSAGIPSFPAVLGYDFSGVVVKSPYEAHPFAPGTEVYGMTMVPRTSGSYAQYVAVSSLSVAKKPAALSHVEAAGVPLAALTAWGMVVEVAKAHQGQRILIHAASGGVGHFALQFAKYFGAHVIATGSTRNQEWLRELGADEVIDHATTRFEDAVSNVDVVIDLVGNVSDNTGSRSLAVLRDGGLIVNAPTGSWPTFLAEAADAGMRATTYKVAPDGDSLSTISRLLESGDVRVFVDQVFELGHAAQAHEALESGHTRGKIVLTIPAH
ncbi:NADPH:quinone reductase [Mycetocola zhujimingii]|uniref:NADPH:quinone reductase n=2 Tax=Mycetocola zhujimingii TaxID=2079792 RepID=A0A2U1TAP6_9MICO|nr:NADP-dependent oxidoreductase [Mycetocola zhujimingii]PWC04758.1 NADPH:quinone reductase [Mycetocola zhujimingii]